ncbi:DUF1688-domain-containing protein [Linderina pennispora]|uniref:DUF1688-domain-containing protein n=1 Tax=Linderina pennispora TaxID=61395 RepID=A0A1Y1WNR7_9FUNG|nr:DUF1688-domain-containing protein [Linderina pennispora]ORX74774.1 DUF1688-domain-containing protein [Linderina pennispora]
MAASGSNILTYLKSLAAVRERSQKVYQHAEHSNLRHFSFDASKIESVADYVISLIERDHGSIAKVPTHGRWRSYVVKADAESPRDLVAEHVDAWKAQGTSESECTRRIIDLFVVSVLIDAGAGSRWKYKDALGTFERTEGLGLAALRMFEKGVFSSSKENPYQADAVALQKLTDKDLLDGFQVSDSNPLLAGENRAQLLRSLGDALQLSPQYFASADSQDLARPGCMLDYLVRNADAGSAVSVEKIWEVIIVGFDPVWPKSRTQFNGVSLGDVWLCDTLVPVYEDDIGNVLAKGKVESLDCLVAFHKLSQWLTWSLLEVVTRLGNLAVTDTELLTGLPEYRNGGVFVDMGVLTLNQDDVDRGLRNAKGGIPQFEGSDYVIVEWRAMTVVLLDKVAEIIKDKSGLTGSNVPTMFLGRVLEGGTWKAGREKAAELRPATKEPPINIISDGTLF